MVKTALPLQGPGFDLWSEEVPHASRCSQKEKKKSKQYVLAVPQKIENRIATDELINPMWHICLMSYYSAFKRKEILTPAAGGMNQEDVTLGGRSRSWKDRYCVIPLIREPEDSHIRRDRKSNGSCQGRREMRGVSI